MDRRITGSVIAAMLFATHANAEVVEFQAVLDEAWDPVFTLFPMAGTGSTATGTFSLRYDTDTNTATDVTLNIQGLSLADLRTPDVDRAHVHPPNSQLRIFDVGVMGLVDVPGGIALTGGTGFNSFEVWELDLLAEQTWINIHTLAFPAGEIAGRLVRVNELPGLARGALAGLVALLLLAGISAVAQRPI
jgi:hypothetical protein